MKILGGGLNFVSTSGINTTFAATIYIVRYKNYHCYR